MKSIKSLSLFFFTFLWVNTLQAQQLNFSWANAMGAPNTIGSASAVGISIAHDNFGNVFLAGTFQDTIDFDPGPGTTWVASTGAYDIFIAKFNIQGNLIWIKSFAGTSTEGPVESHSSRAISANDRCESRSKFVKFINKLWH